MLEILIVAGISFFLGSMLKEALMRTVFKELLKDLNISEEQLRKVARARGLKLAERELAMEPEAPGPEQVPHYNIRVEQHQGYLYAYDANTDQFMGQGKDRDELIRSLEQRFKRAQFTVPKDLGGEFFLDKSVDRLS